MNLANRKETPRRCARAIIYTILRLLLGLALICLIIPPLTIGRMDWGDCMNVAEEAYDFFGNWISVWLLIGFIISLPILGIYLVREAILWLTHPKRKLKRWGKQHIQNKYQKMKP